MTALLLKLSGEALGGENGFGIEPDILRQLTRDIGALIDAGSKVAVVLGGGNIFRGQALAANGLDRVAGDRMGMLATVMNGLACSDFLHQAGVANQVYSAVGISGVVAGYDRNIARAAMQRGEVVILCGGTGNPYFTTDTAACLRGIELGVDVVVKATNIDGVYNADPKVDPDATRFDTITYDEVVRRELAVMDLTAIVLCKENDMPLVVCDINAPNALVEIARGSTVGTRVVKSTT
ncbi:MAG: UMP kinase [Pseudomonadota bacterium]